MYFGFKQCLKVRVTSQLLIFLDTLIFLQVSEGKMIFPTSFESHSPLLPAPFPRKVYRFNRGKIYKETNVLQRHQGSECKNPKGNENFGTTKEASAPASSPHPRYFLLNRVQFSQPYLPVFLSLLILCWAMGTVRAFMCPVRCER